jgi:hypothetical protein
VFILSFGGVMKRSWVNDFGAPRALAKLELEDQRRITTAPPRLARSIFDGRRIRSAVLICRAEVRRKPMVTDQVRRGQSRGLRSAIEATIRCRGQRGTKDGKKARG